MKTRIIFLPCIAISQFCLTAVSAEILNTPKCTQLLEQQRQIKTPPETLRYAAAMIILDTSGNLTATACHDADVHWQYRSNLLALERRLIFECEAVPRDDKGNIQADLTKDKFDQTRTEEEEAFRKTRAKMCDAKPALEKGDWLVITGSWPSADSFKVKARIQLLSQHGVTARAVKTEDFPNLAPGLTAVVLGPTSKDDAEMLLASVQAFVPDAFIKRGR